MPETELQKKQTKWGALYQRDCMKCGCPLGFGKTVEGKVIPLDLRAPVYSWVANRYNAEEVVRTHLAYVSHFATCKFADEFSGSKK